MTAPYYGKRNPGSLTAASPGDTLYFNFSAHNDSGDSEVLTGLATTDIEVIKNGAATVRATDSGYSLVSDTGMVGDRGGLYRCSIQLFNTADDSTFYAVGGWYQAFVDSVTVDGKTVRFWLGSWEIGFDITAADTGINDRLGKIGFDVDTGLRDTLADYDTGLRDFITDAKNELDTGGVNVTATVDTGVVNQAVWQGNASRTITSFDVDTGLRDLITDAKNELDTGIKSVLALADTGKIATAVWAGDTGIRDLITDSKNELDTGIKAHIDDLDTGLTNLSVNLNQIRGDTGGADRFYRYTQKLDTGGDATVSASVDTGQVNQAVWQANAERKLTVDTGIADQVWKTATAGYNDDTGTFGELLRIPATATVDTGVVNQAVWQGNASRTITSFDVDTGLRDLITDAKNELDTGIKAILALADTGKIATAVWAGDTGLRDHITNVDTGIMARFDDLAEDTGGVNINAIQGDTGAAGWLKAAFLNGFADTGLYSRIDKLAEDTGGVNINSIQGDTGAAAWLKATFAQGFTDTGLNERLARIQSDVDTGLRVYIDDSDTGVKDTIADLDTGIRALLALQDTGAIATAVWAGDTGLRDHITNVDTGIMARFDDLAEDTGGVIVTAINDTGLNERLDAIEAQTAKLTFDTGNEIRADVRRVNNVTVQGTGENADKWRPGT